MKTPLITSAVAHPDGEYNGVPMHTHKVTFANGRTVQLWRKDTAPIKGFHGWEETHPDATEPLSQGGLIIVKDVVEDFDGTYFLPSHVAAALRHVGVTVPEDCLQ